MAFGRGTVNKVMLVGRLGSDPELKYTPGGTAVATLSIATNFVWRDKDGNQQEKTEWHRVVAWRKTAEFVQFTENVNARFTTNSMRLNVPSPSGPRNLVIRNILARPTSMASAFHIRRLE